MSDILLGLPEKLENLYPAVHLLRIVNFGDLLSRRVLSKLPTDNGAKVPFQHMPTNFIVKDKSVALSLFDLHFELFSCQNHICKTKSSKLNSINFVRHVHVALLLLHSVLGINLLRFIVPFTISQVPPFFLKSLR